MNIFFKKKTFTPFVTLIVALVCGAIGAALVLPNSTQPSVDELYALSMQDAVFAQEDEIYPLVTLSPNNPDTSWSEDGRQVLLLTYHRYPESYQAGTQVVISWGEVWTFTDQEILSWYINDAQDITNWPLRLNQLLGLPPNKEYTHITAMWVEPQYAIRPAYITSPTAQMQAEFPQEMLQDEGLTEFEEWYMSWFDGNIIGSYFDSAYPWTRLGYTYDWADNGEEYGLSEFLILDGANVEVEFTKTTEEFVAWMQAQAEAAA